MSPILSQAASRQPCMPDKQITCRYYPWMRLSYCSCLVFSLKCAHGLVQSGGVLIPKASISPRMAQTPALEMFRGENSCNTIRLSNLFCCYFLSRMKKKSIFDERTGYFCIRWVVCLCWKNKKLGERNWVRDISNSG